MLPGVWEEAGGGCSSKGLASRPGSRGDESVGELGRERRCENLTSAHQLTRKKKKRTKKKAVGVSEERRTAPLLPSRARSYNQGGGTPPFLIPAEQQLQARPRPGARRRQRPQGAAPTAPGPSLSLHGRPGRRAERGPPAPQEERAVRVAAGWRGWGLCHLLGALPGSAWLEAAAPEASSGRLGPPASLIGNPPFGIAPSGCLCTGQSRPRCG